MLFERAAMLIREAEISGRSAAEIHTNHISRAIRDGIPSEGRLMEILNSYRLARRVRALAEGRVEITVKASWRVRSGTCGVYDFLSPPERAEATARDFAAKGADRRLVRVTTTKRRIRRASKA